MIPITRPLLGEAEAAAARRVILGGWTSQGPEVAAFESEFAAWVGARHACAVSNCTTALHLALQVAGVGPGDEVVTVSHSFIATANSVRHCAAVPVFVDIGAGGFNIDVDAIESAITERTRAILVVHQLGMPCDLARIAPIAARHGLPLVEDAACALGSEILWQGEWQRIGRPHSDAACFSFHPRKVISTGDGGMVTTGHTAWDAQFRRLRQHAMSVSDRARHGSDRVVFETYDQVGYNYRLTDLQAAVGREQMRRLPQIVRSRRRLAEAYARLLRPIEGLGLPIEPHWASTNWQSYCVRLPSGCGQATVMQALLDAGVATRRGVMCCHREAAYAKDPVRRPLPRSEEAQDRCILLPLYPQMSFADQQTVASALALACERQPAQVIAPAWAGARA